MFYVQSHRFDRGKSKKIEAKTNYFMLTEDNWNDYGYETTFFLDYWKEEKQHEIGLIRILHKDDWRTRRVIPSEFSFLNEEYISLGYDEKVYKKLIKLFGKNEAKNVLKKLNDISVIGLENNENFNIESEGIINSFFRSSDGRILYSDGYKTFFLEKESEDRDYSFVFKYFPTGNGESDQLDIEIDFKEFGILPNRMFTIIGKNGVGKTRLLNQLAEALFDSSKKENKGRFQAIKLRNDFVESNVPLYKKIIAISFSVFDNFYKGANDKKEEQSKSSVSMEYKTDNEELNTKFNNYTYIGLHKRNGETYLNEELIDINRRAYKRILENKYEDIWLKSLNSSNILTVKLSKDNFNEEEFFSGKFSSGQSIFISMLTRLLSEIEYGSLIFLDEPELYLHPNGIANLARIYFNILKEFKSYAILCTHSPILVQEMSSKYVRNFLEVDNTINFVQPSIETFGANISDITTEIFNVQETESLYKTTLKEWSVKYTEDEILDMFNNNLSFKTELYLSNLYKDSE